MPSPTHRTASAAPRNSKADQQSAPASLPLNRYLLFFIPAVVGCAADLWTKHAVFAWRGLPPHWRGDAPGGREIYWLWEDILGIETALNQGALFGIGQGKVWLFACLSFVAIAAIIYWLFVAKAARDAFLTFALGLVLGGILGNLYDRLGLWGGATPDGQTIYAVRDWILVSYGGAEIPKLGRDWPNFNIADSLLVCGAGLLIWQAFRAPKSQSEQPAPTKNN